MATISKSHRICSNFLLILESWINCISILFILMKYIIQFETLAISLSFISQRAVKAWIIENCFISAMVNLMIVISKIFYTNMLRGFSFQNLIHLSRKSVSGAQKLLRESFSFLHILDWVGHS